MATKKGKQVRSKVPSVRMEPAMLDKIIKEYGSYTKWVYLKIRNDQRLRGKK